MLELKRVQASQGRNQFCFTGTLSQGKCTALMGASGAGKTTLLNLLAGFVMPDSGQLLWQGQEAGEVRVSHLPSDGPQRSPGRGAGDPRWATGPACAGFGGGQRAPLSL